jgi:hypothetical protein
VHIPIFDNWRMHNETNLSEYAADWCGIGHEEFVAAPRCLF